mmetsp:Transcript_30154/g.29453  ORF Transcript_30154/g.29453 Transcript_30154/m.29453 type:complete len:201 (+) Transcript_30154:370-972(+)
MSEPVSEVSSQIFSFDCLIDTRSENSTSNGTDTSMMNIFYLNLLVYAFLPLLIVFGCYFVWVFICLFSRNFGIWNSRSISSIVITLFLVHPDIVQAMFSIFNCYNVDGDYRIYENLDVLCQGSTYRLFSLAVALPGIVIWAFGIPFFVYLLMLRVKKFLNTVAVKEKFGFLYRGFKKQFFYWEIVIMYRKIILIVIQIFF